MLFLCCLLFSFSSLSANEIALNPDAEKGRVFVVEYAKCNKAALANMTKLQKVMKAALTTFNIDIEANSIEVNCEQCPPEGYCVTMTGSGVDLVIRCYPAYELAILIFNATDWDGNCDQFGKVFDQYFRSGQSMSQLHTIARNYANRVQGGRDLLLTAEYVVGDKTVLDAPARLQEAMKTALLAFGLPARIYPSSCEKCPPDGYCVTATSAKGDLIVHAYPQYNLCIITLDTINTVGNTDKFKQILESFLKPAKTHYDSYSSDE